MTLRLLHTADWHLGQTLHGVSRAYEHEQFLAWLLDRLEEHAVDALIVAGDVFDVASPSSAALTSYYDFLAALRTRLPDLDVVIVAGNHDSPARIDAPADVLGALGITVVGDAERGRPFAPLHHDGAVAGWVVPVPFLRPRDLPTIEEADEVGVDRAHGRMIEGYRRLYRERLAQVREEATADHAIVATGHCYMSGGVVSELSERKIQVGHQYALPADVFPAEISYVALGHLHRAQAIGGFDHVRYSGSPIPLSLAERGYEHQVLLVDLEGPHVKSVQPLFVPRAVDIQVVPEEHAPLAEVLDKLRALPVREADEDERTLPFIEVRVRREGAHPLLRRDVESAIEGRRARLVRIDARREKVTADAPAPTAQLETLAPVDVFDAAFVRARGEAPPQDMRRRFLELLEAVQREEIT